MAVSNPAKMLHLASILYCAEYLTDGFVPKSSLKGVYLGSGIGKNSFQAKSLELVDAGLWVEYDGGYLVHDFLTMNPQLERRKVEAERERWKRNKRGQRDQMSTGDKGDPF